MSRLIEASKETFERAVLDAKGLVVVDFWAPWCPPCRALIPLLDELATEFTGRATFAKLNVDDDPHRAVAMGVRGVPTVVFLRNGIEIDRIVGADSQAALRARIEAHLDQGNGSSRPLQLSDPPSRQSDSQKG